MFKVKISYILIIIGIIMFFISGFIFIYISYTIKEPNIEKVYSILKEMKIDIAKETIYEIINVMKLFGFIHIVIAITNSISIVSIYRKMLERINILYIAILISSIIGLFLLAGFLIGALISIIGSILGIVKRNNTTN